MDDGWMGYVCGEQCCEGIGIKQAYNVPNQQLNYFLEEIDSVVNQAKDNVSVAFTRNYDRVIDLLARAHKPDTTDFQAQLYYRELLEILADEDTHNKYAESIQEEVAATQDAAISATLMFYPSVIIAYMGKKPARVMKPKIRTPEKNEFNPGVSFGGDSIADLARQTSADVLTRYTNQMRTRMEMPDLTPRDFITDVNELIDVIDSAAENISTTEIMEITRQVADRINKMNPGVVRAYRRVAVIDNKTCVGCLALHGKVYQSSDEFESHPRCRCMLVPISATWMEYSGVQGGAVPQNLTRDELIGILPRNVLEDILGPGRMALYDAGLSLDKMIYIEQTAEYGSLIRITPLSVLREQLSP